MSFDGYISEVDITSVQEICELNYKIWTHGVQQDYLFHRTKPEPGMPIYRDRPSLVYYLCRLSVMTRLGLKVVWISSSLIKLLIPSHSFSRSEKAFNSPSFLLVLSL